MNELENIFVSEKKQGKISIKVTFKPNSQGQNRQKSYHFNTANNDTRSDNKKSIRKYCEEQEKPVVFKSHLKNYTTENFWDVIKGDLPATTKADIEKYRSLVLNPFSHYNTERHKIKSELDSAIQSVKSLKQELNRFVSI